MPVIDGFKKFNRRTTNRTKKESRSEDACTRAVREYLTRCPSDDLRESYLLLSPNEDGVIRLVTNGPLNVTSSPGSTVRTIIEAVGHWYIYGAREMLEEYPSFFNLFSWFELRKHYRNHEFQNMNRAAKAGLLSDEVLRECADFCSDIFFAAQRGELYIKELGGDCLAIEEEDLLLETGL